MVTPPKKGTDESHACVFETVVWGPAVESESVWTIFGRLVLAGICKVVESAIARGQFIEAAKKMQTAVLLQTIDSNPSDECLNEVGHGSAWCHVHSGWRQLCC